MRIAVIGALEGPEEVTHRRFRAPSDPWDHDLLLLDARGAWAEYAPLVERDGPPPTLSIAGGDALQRDCRAWQAILDAHVKGGGLLAVLAAEVPVLGVHTLDRVQAWNALAALPLPVATAGPVTGGPWQAIGGAPLRDFVRTLLPFLAPTVALQGGTPLVREATGHRAVAIHGSLGAGRILVLPATMAGLTNDWDAVAAAFRRLSDSMALSREGAAPRWIDREVLADEQSHHLELARIGREQAALAVRAEVVKATLSALRLRRALAHARGRPFVDAAAEAFWFLGCRVQQGPEGDHDLIVLDGRRATLVRAIDGAATVQDLDGLSLAHAAAGIEQGHLLLNQAPERAPAERPPAAFAPALARRAEEGHLGLLTGLDLLALQEAVRQRALTQAEARGLLFARRALSPPMPRWRSYLVAARTD